MSGSILANIYLYMFDSLKTGHSVKPVSTRATGIEYTSTLKS